MRWLILAELQEKKNEPWLFFTSTSGFSGTDGYTQGDVVLQGIVDASLQIPLANTS